MRKILIILSIFSLFLFILFYSCPSPVKEKVATPVITPTGGIIFNPNPTTVTITCETDGATIYYTTDGTDPTTSSSLYEGPFIIEAGTVKAMAAKENYLDSDIATEQYILASGVVISSEYPWTRFVSGSADDLISDVAIDDEGNIYIVGCTPSSYSNYNQTNHGSMDVLLAKYDSRGILQWVRLRGGSTFDLGTAITLDSNGYIYLTGFTYSSFDGNICQGNSDVFFMKFNKDGNWIWTKFKGSSEIEEANDIAIDGNNNIYIVGETRGNFDGQTIDGNQDILILKYDSNGNWIKTIFDHVENYEDSASCIDIDNIGNIYIGGAYTTNEPPYDNNLYIAKFDSNLVKKLSIHSDYKEEQFINDIKIDSNNNIYVTGKTSGLIYYKPLKGGYDIFLIKFDANLAYQDCWIYGGIYDDGAYGLYINSDNSKYIVGFTSSSFGGQTNKGDQDIVIIKLNPIDDIIYTMFKGGSAEDYGTSIICNETSGKKILYIVGDTWSSFDGQTNKGAHDGFIIKYIEP